MTVAVRAPRLIVLSGGADGTLYVRQLLRAVEAGRLATGRIHVVDRDPGCQATRLAHPLLVFECADWVEWLDARLDDFGAPEGHADQLVPYHWAPHVLLDWLERRLKRAGRGTRRGGPWAELELPFERGLRDGGRALSYATWLCPPTCIEPALCPHTRGARDWSLAARLERVHPAPAAAGERTSLEPLVLRTLHLVYGVSAIAVPEIHAAAARAAAGTGPRGFVVATSSHCHALATRLDVDAVPPPA